MVHIDLDIDRVCSLKNTLLFDKVLKVLKKLLTSTYATIDKYLSTVCYIVPDFTTLVHK